MFIQSTSKRSFFFLFAFLLLSISSFSFADSLEDFSRRASRSKGFRNYQRQLKKHPDKNKVFVTANVGPGFWLSNFGKLYTKNPAMTYEATVGYSFNRLLKLGLAAQHQSQYIKYVDHNYFFKKESKEIEGNFYSELFALKFILTPFNSLRASSIKLTPFAALGAGSGFIYQDFPKAEQSYKGLTRPLKIKTLRMGLVFVGDIGFLIGSENVSATIGCRANSYDTFVWSYFSARIIPYIGFRLMF